MLGNIFDHLAKRCEIPAYIQLGNVAVQSAEDARVVATDKENFVALKVEVAVDEIYQHPNRRDQDVECVF
jgi:hypothetical protein